MSAIQFFSENINFTLSHHSEVRRWINHVLQDNHASPSAVNFIFASDEYVREINNQYLKHNYYTDIITFQYSEPENGLEADIYISVDRVRENADLAGLTFEEELYRVMVHGVLHTLGHKDATPAEKEGMRKLENHYLALRQFK
jgi:rRNA maturation RNase YbeY